MVKKLFCDKCETEITVLIMSTALLIRQGARLTTIHLCKKCSKLLFKILKDNNFK